MKRLQGKLQRCKLVCLSSTQAGWWCHLQTLSAEASFRMQACHLFQQPVSLYRCQLSLRSGASRMSQDTEVREQDWLGKDNGSVRTFILLNTEVWKNTEISQYSQTKSLTNSCLWVLWHFSKESAKSYWCLPQSYQLQKILLQTLSFWLRLNAKIKLKTSLQAVYNYCWHFSWFSDILQATSIMINWELMLD